MQDYYTFTILRAGSIEPRGWIKKQLQQDLTEGYIGEYDNVNPTVTKDVFVNQDLVSRRRLGLRKEWWSGEHEGYWKDGVIRMAFLTQNQEYIKLADEWMAELLTNIDSSGYIGIYKDCEKPGCRFYHRKGNGELWVTSRMLMAMLAYYEFTDNQKVLKAVEKAVGQIMTNYNSKNYFSTESRGGGVSHGIGFFENLEWLYRITGEEEYLHFAKKLYSDFNKGYIRDDDLKTQNLLNKEQLFEKHGAHIAEGLFVPRFIAAISPEDKYTIAAENTMYKLKLHLTPSGAMRCDEWIKGRKGTADERYEYCGIAEMISPLNIITSLTGNFELSDMLETMAFNAGQGSRFPVLTALSYLTKDNRIHIKHREIARRESYDASHLAAACCALNGSRLMPYFVEGMWMKSTYNDALVANLYGPCELNTTINNIPVHISENTEYPFSDNIVFNIRADDKTKFPIIFRKPYNCQQVEINAPNNANIEKKGDHFVVTNTWSNQEQKVEVKFNFEIQKVPQPASKSVKNKGMFIKRGALVYALPFNYNIDTVKEYRNSGFYRYKIRTVDSTGWNYKLEPSSQFIYCKKDHVEDEYPWKNAPVYLKGNLITNKKNKEEVILVPMGTTVFRRVTFSVSNNSKMNSYEK